MGWRGGRKKNIKLILFSEMLKIKRYFGKKGNVDSNGFSEEYMASVSKGLDYLYAVTLFIFYCKIRTRFLPINLKAWCLGLKL